MVQPRFPSLGPAPVAADQDVACFLGGTCTVARLNPSPMTGMSKIRPCHRCFDSKRRASAASVAIRAFNASRPENLISGRIYAISATVISIP